MFDQAPNIIGVSREPLIVVLRAIQPAAGKAASIIGENGVVRRQMFRHHFEAVGFAAGPRNHEHERAAAALIACLCRRHLSRLMGFARLRLTLLA